MIIRLRVTPPLGTMLGLAASPGSQTLDVALEPGTTLSGLFATLALTYPLFERLIDPEPGEAVGDSMIAVDNRLITEPDGNQVALHDGSEVVLFARYRGG